LNRVYLADLPICARPFEFAATLAADTEVELPRFDAGAAHAEWIDWSTPKPREGVALDLGQCVAAMRAAMPADAIICN
ncbi:hypothetical protein, partial [Klebsiella pneumoniae]